MVFSGLKKKSFLLPTVFFVTFLLIYALLFSTGERKYSSLARSLIQWDGQHYLSIARDGYEAFPCPDNPNLICGNVGWFPMYPIIASVVGKIVGITGLSFSWILLLTNALAFWLALLVLFSLVRQKYNQQTAVYSIAALLLFPTAFYFLTAFPYALYLLLAVIIFQLLEQKRYLLAVIPTGMLAVTYPSGVVIGLPPLWILISKWRQHTPHQKRALFLTMAAIGITLFLYGVYNWWKFDDFLLYVHFQSKPYYAHQATFPLIPIIQALLKRSFNDPVWLMLVFCIMLVTIFYQKKLPVSWQLFLFGVLLFTPTFGTTTCYYRHIVVAFPLTVMIGLACQSRRRWLFIVYAVASVILMWTVYLKYYKLGMLM